MARTAASRARTTVSGMDLESFVEVERGPVETAWGRRARLV
jgi:hypothetical protein